MEPAISLRGVVKAFGDFRAVDDVTLDIPAGGIFGLLGPNGAGKSTTIRMIMDIIRPDTGTITVLGKPAPENVRNHVGYLPEERGLYKKMKVLDVLEFQGSLKGKSPKDARVEAKTWLEKLEIADWADKKVEELSKGMQQKIQFAAAVLGKPPILILDEPFSGMDPVNQNLFKDQILDLNRQGTTIVFSTHLMETAERLCSDILLINKGRKVIGGSLRQIKEAYGKNTIALRSDGGDAALMDSTLVSKIIEHSDEREVQLADGADAQTLLRKLMDAGAVITKFEQVEPSLNDIFVQQIGGAG